MFSERPFNYLPGQLGEDKSDYKPAEALQTIAEVHVLVGKENLTREYEELPRSCHWAAWAYSTANFNLC